MSIRVAIAEDNRRYRTGLETVLGLSPGFDLVGSFASATAMLKAVQESPAVAAGWDVVIMDIEMPGITGIEATRKLKEWRSDVKIVMVTVFEEPATILDAICAGADGYVLKKTPAPELLEQLKVLHAGGASLTPGVAATVLNLVRQGTPKKVTPAMAPTRLDLTTREQDVLRGLVAGQSYKQIAAELSISLDTVRSHIRNLYKKLQVQNVAAAVSRAVREGLI